MKSNAIEFIKTIGVCASVFTVLYLAALLIAWVCSVLPEDAPGHIVLGTCACYMWLKLMIKLDLV